MIDSYSVPLYDCYLLELSYLLHIHNHQSTSWLLLSEWLEVVYTLHHLITWLYELFPHIILYNTQPEKYSICIPRIP